ncbi:cardiolipin synthase [Peptostreptococcus equinus]|uniref:Cardiolipin synthase n=1 Tax=Peptostreptococcus equinus TaxID=3003601 RepID=A0ABY7JQB0_9FIRM|nr:cardiolipin synthase [Peptostreptococcus sp. CBA3647]WAW15534.1 cardiolipin synthase [Peptostreptococcus sp. CBA3647]
MDKHKIKDKFNEEKRELKEKKHLVKPIFLVTILILLQIFLFIFIYTIFIQKVHWINWIWIVIRFILIIHIINLDKPIDYRVAWIIPIASLPVFGIMLYLFLEILPGPRMLSRRLEKIKIKNTKLLTANKNIPSEMEHDPRVDYGLDRYLDNIIDYPMHKNTDLQYYTQGEEYFEKLIVDLRNAKDFILMEFFIIKPGIMLDTIVDILSDKVKEGVDVKFMYDGMNAYHLPSSYKNYLESLGIDTLVFGAVKPILSTYHNNRNHRKIVVIDNEIAYTGGVNLSDEYINAVEKFGHWKDNGIRLEGQAVKNFTVMFFNLWDLSSGNEYNLNRYLSHELLTQSQAYVQPFDDAPNDQETVGENVYVDVLNQAKDYVYIMTPYLILSDKVINAIKFAAKRCVDVRIMMPGIPDKKIAYNMGRSYYEHLIKNGVKIYEYSPGFLHAKSFVSDDMTSVAGTINLDFRSLHLHYENAVLVYDEDFALKLKEDFLNTQEKCNQMTIEKYRELNFIYRLSGRVLKLFAPMM